jgi:DNA-binding NtrC family response regulator
MIKSILTRRILVVDPDPSLRELLRYVLVSDGHQVDEAQGRSQAFDKLNHGNFDVVLTGSDELDVKHDMPFPQIKVHGEATPVLKISDDPLSDPSEELRKFMFNPFDLVSIRQALAAVCQIVSVCKTAISASQAEKLSAA